MRLLAVGTGVPSQCESNGDRVNMVLAANTRLGEVGQKRLRRTTSAMLAMSGAQERRVCASDESAWTLGCRAAEEAVARAGIDPQSIDVVISGGVGRGFLEPATACAFAAAVGARRAVCFDIAEACMGWLRGVHIAHHLLHAGTFRTAMILNVEANAVYRSLKMTDPDSEMAYILPQLTIGEAATATLLTADGPEWPFWFRSAPEGHDLCKLPLPSHSNWRPADAPALEAFRFYCHFQDMNRFTFDRFKGEYLKFLDGEVRAKGLPIDLALTHASEYSGWQRWAEECGLKSQFFSVYPHFGNVVSASVPLGLAQAIHTGRLQPGQGVYIYVASSGMSIGGTWFRYT